MSLSSPHKTSFNLAFFHAMRRGKTRSVILLILVLGVLGGLYFGFWHYQIKRFQAVRPGVFYRVAQPTEFGIQYLVRRHGVKTILSLQLFDFRLRKGWLDPGQEEGLLESQFVPTTGAQYLQWPMGTEVCWPWITPWQYEEFFRLVDNPQNRPIAIHCMGGRHRTGTISALFRLEYDRWPVEQALAEMYSFDFGYPIYWQEHNLRTYVPRPLPHPQQWQEILSRWKSRLRSSSEMDYEQLLRILSLKKTNPDIQAALEQDLLDNKVFALPIMARLLETPDAPLASSTANAAMNCLERPEASISDWIISAGLVADFGSIEQQQRLLKFLEEGAARTIPLPRDEALVDGVTNRYTPNRIAFLKPLLDDKHPHQESTCRQYRHCDTAVIRLSSILNQQLLPEVHAATSETWEIGLKAAQDWFNQHPEGTSLSQLLPPTGNNPLQAGPYNQEEDTSRMLR